MVDDTVVVIGRRPGGVYGENPRELSWVGNMIRAAQNPLVRVADLSITVGEFMADHRWARWSMTALEIAAGPMAFAARRLVMASPIGDAINALSDRLMGASTDFINNEARLNDRARAGQIAIGGMAVAGVLLGGAAWLVRSVGRMGSFLGGIRRNSNHGAPSAPTHGFADSPAPRRVSAPETPAAGMASRTRMRSETSARMRYMGRTPDKYSRTGREVVERMRREGKIVGEGPLLRGNPNNLQLRAPDGTLHRIDDTIDMGHKTDAVNWWNAEGRNYGPKSPEVRQWMLDPNNYELQLRSLNRSAGASLGVQYLAPKTL
jgi:hypothetical protein